MPSALFHSDPHAGNLFYTRERRLAILDWSLVGHLGDAERIALVQILLAAITLRSERIIDILQLLDVRQMTDSSALTLVVERSLRQIRRGACPGLAWLIKLLDDATQNARLRVAADLLLFRKSLHTLEGVLGEMHANSFSSDQALFYDFIRHFYSEWPQRWFGAANSHDYATRLSNTDLAEALWSCPLTAARFWQAELLNCIRGEQLFAVR
jgi:ubiquinone biosynthesis protein